MILLKFIYSQILDFLLFPFWWYTIGFKKRLFYFFKKTKQTNKDLALGILLRNFFRPMYGDYSKSGRIISFFARLILIFYKLFLFLILFLLNLAFLFFYLSLPIFIIYKIYRLI